MDANEMAFDETPHSSLNGAFRKAGHVGNGLVAKARCLGTAGDGLAPEMQVDQVRRGRMIVAYQVAHQYFKNVFINVN
jgi:hypothetical protein